MKRKAIPIIDLFAGPGGLGEGFTSQVDDANDRYFKIALSIEKNEFAHQTLSLRSFLRQFPHKQLPAEYYEFLQGKLDSLDTLYGLYPNEAEKAREEAWLFELGKQENHHLIDKRIRKALEGEKNFILIGGPPCQAYSLVGRARRQEGEGLNKDDLRVYLYREYYRILAVHQPPVFIMENVKGLLSSKIENELIFKQLLGDIQNPVDSYKKLQGKLDFAKSKVGYKIYSLVKSPVGLDLITGDPLFDPKDFIIRAEDYGVPQTRHRVILLGVRNDIKGVPEVLKRQQSLVPLEKVISGLPRLRSGLSKTKDDAFEWREVVRNISQTNLKDEIDKNVWKLMVSTSKNLESLPKSRGGIFVPEPANVDYLKDWYLDKKIEGVINHETRTHIQNDLYRYLFASCFTEVYGLSPKLSNFPPSLLPKHKNVDKGVDENKFSDRFRAQVRSQPSKTITSHISKDGHYFIHPDPFQCRSFTVREAARIQTFPDNYFFCGPRTEQYHQVGNAVPPYLAYQIAIIVKNIMPQVPTF